MRNVTISLSDELARWTRIWAAEHDTSVSAMLSRILQEAKEKESRYASAMGRFLSTEATTLSDGKGYPGRDDLYDR